MSECEQCGSGRHTYYCHDCECWLCSDECWNDHNRRTHGRRDDDG